MNRRRFVEVLAIAAGGVAATSLCPSSVQAASRAVMASRLAPYAKSGPLTDWTIDDMTGPYPRYAHAIGCSRSRAGLVHSDPLDFL
jgi:hypothetical protein